MWRRLAEDRNQHYDDLACRCWFDRKAMSRFKEQPKVCPCWMCRNERTGKGNSLSALTLQERRAKLGFEADLI